MEPDAAPPVRQGVRAHPPELDARTLRRAARGDAAASRALVARYQRPIFALLSRLIGDDPALVEDLAQETFLRVFKALPRFDPKGPAKASSWMLTIATRVALDALRKQPRRPQLVAVVPERAAETPGPERRAADRQLGDRLAQAMARLPEAQRAALLLSAAHGLPHAQIAEALGVPVGTVKSRINRARQALRDTLEAMR